MIIIDRISSFGYVTYTADDTLPAVCIVWRIDNIVKLANISNDEATEPEFGLLDGGNDGELSGADLVDICKMFAMQQTFLFEKANLMELFIMGQAIKTTRGEWLDGIITIHIWC